MDSNFNSPDIKLSKSDSIESTEPPDSMTLSDWESLEILRIKMIQSSRQGKENIREMIERVVNGAMNPKSGSPNLSASTFDDDLRPSLIKQTAHFLSQFHKMCKDREQKKMEDLNNEDSFEEIDPDTEMKNDEQRSLEDIRWEELQSVWSGFEKYYNNAVEKAKNKPSGPLELDTMLQEIFQYLPCMDLLNCRLVNKNWNKNSSYVYSKHPDYFCKIADLKTFCEYSLVTEKTIFRKVKISLQTNSFEEFCKFVATAGPYIKNLHIKENKAEEAMEVISTCEYQARLKKVFENTCHLESLTLWHLPEAVFKGNFVFNDYELKFFSLPPVKSLDLISSNVLDGLKFIDGLLKMVPNIRECSLMSSEDSSKRDDYDNNAMRRAGSIMAAFFQPLKLRDFLSYDIWSDFWGEMRNQKLKILRIVVPTVSNKSVFTSYGLDNFQAFLASQSETLELLRVEVNRDLGYQTRIKLPSMKKLSYLDLSINGSPFLPLQSDKLPNLHEICLRALSDLKFFYVPNVFPKVQKLQFASGSGTNDHVLHCSHNELELLGRLEATFPNLRKLENSCNHMSDKALAIIFSFSNLEYLSLHIFETNLGNNVNCTLSGFPIEVAWMLPHLIASKTAIQPPQSSLRNMKRLKQLTLSFKSKPRNSFVIDEVGVQFGLLSLPRLDRLMLLGDFTVTEENATELRKYHSTVVISSDTPEESAK